MALTIRTPLLQIWGMKPYDFDDIDPFQLYQYDTELSGYKIYPFDIGEVGLQTAHGYFTRLATDVNVDVGGPSNHDDVTLTLDAAGWHAIGNPFVKEVNVADLVVNDGTVDRTFDDAVAAGLVEGTPYRWYKEKQIWN